MAGIFEIDLNNLMNNMKNNVEENLKTFEDLLNLDGSLNREVYLGDIEAGTGSDVDGYIRFWNYYDNKNNIPIQDRKPIKIYIDSYGGSLTDSFTIVDSIKLSKTPVWTICTGCAYSGGFFIFISGKRRIAYSHASFLFHEGSTGTSGTSSQFENYTAFYRRQLNQLAQITMNNTNIDEKEYKEIHKDDIWYDAHDGIKKGFVDEIAEDFV